MSRALTLRSPFDEAADARFRQLYHRHFGVVWAVISAMGVEARYREDVAQETWALAFRKRDRLRADASERAWVAALARGVALRHRRAERRQARKHLALVTRRIRPRPPHERCDAKRTAEAVLATLNPDQRIAYVLVHAHGLSAIEVAAATESSPNTVYSRLRLARRTVQRAAEHARLEEETIARGVIHEGVRARGRVWAGLVASLPVGAASPTTSGVLALAAAISVAWGGWTADPPPPLAVAPATAPHQAVPDAAAASVSVAPMPPAAVHDEPSPTRSLATPPPGHPNRSGRGPDRTRSPKPGTLGGAPPVAPTLDVQANLLARARQTMREGDVAGALALLTEHATRFKDSPLADIRDATTIGARCLAGDIAGARALARRFATTYPSSSARQSVRKSCGGSDGSSGRPDVVGP